MLKVDRATYATLARGRVVGRNKYGARPATVDGIRFDSTKESRRYGELRLLEKAGLIRNLETQPRFPIDVVELWRPGAKRLVNCGFFTADFRYVDVAADAVVVEDTKSGPTKTEAYRLRKRLVEAIHGVKISEV
jgi:Protein of unknown function (DUF1064)